MPLPGRIHRAVAMLENAPLAEWEEALERWLDPALDRLENAERPQWRRVSVRSCRAGRLRYAVSILPTQHVYSADVRCERPESAPTDRHRNQPVSTNEATSAAARTDLFSERVIRSVTWREGRTGALRLDFAAVRIRVAGGARMANGRPQSPRCLR